MATNSNIDIILPGSFSAKKLSFSTPRVLDNGGKVIYISYSGKPLVLQTPEMVCPFGLNKWNNDGKANDKYSLDLSFKGKESREILQKFFDAMQDFDKTLVKAGLDNSQQWFKKKYASLDVVEALYTPTIKFAKDKSTGDITDKYPPTFKINIPFRDGQFDCEVFDKSKNMIDLNEVETKGAKVSAIIRCTGIWIAGSKYGCSFKLMQMRVNPPSTIKGYAFKDLDEKVDQVEDEDDEVVKNVDPKEIFESAEGDESNEVNEHTDVAETVEKENDEPKVSGNVELVESSDDELDVPAKPLPIKKRTSKK